MPAGALNEELQERIKEINYLYGRQLKDSDRES